MAVVLGQLLIALEQQSPLRPVLHMGIARCQWKGRGLIAAHLCNIVRDLQQQRVYGLL
jgi:hypothetical protein